MTGITRFQARFQGFSFAPHRHDTYAVGVTTSGVQAFDYRGESRESGAGYAFVLHPDEPHDGRAGTDCGYGYSIAHIDPGIIRNALGGGPLPFVRDPVSRDPRLVAAIFDLLAIEDPGRDLDAVSAISHLSEVMRAIGDAHGSPPSRLNVTKLRRAEAVLRDTRDRRVSMRELEREVGLSRWELARQFRTYSGISLARFHLLRRLEDAQSMIADGYGISDASMACGFTDQAHLTHAFRRAYGLTPGQWRRFQANGDRKGPASPKKAGR